MILTANDLWDAYRLLSTQRANGTLPQADAASLLCSIAIVADRMALQPPPPLPAGHVVALRVTAELSSRRRHPSAAVTRAHLKRLDRE